MKKNIPLKYIFYSITALLFAFIPEYFTTLTASAVDRPENWKPISEQLSVMDGRTSAPAFDALQQPEQTVSVAENAVRIQPGADAAWQWSPQAPLEKVQPTVVAAAFTGVSESGLLQDAVGKKAGQAGRISEILLPGNEILNILSAPPVVADNGLAGTVSTQPAAGVYQAEGLRTDGAQAVIESDERLATVQTTDTLQPTGEPISMQLPDLLSMQPVFTPQTQITCFSDTFAYAQPGMFSEQTQGTLEKQEIIQHYWSGMLAASALHNDAGESVKASQALQQEREWFQQHVGVEPDFELMAGAQDIGANPDYIAFTEAVDVYADVCLQVAADINALDLENHPENQPAVRYYFESVRQYIEAHGQDDAYAVRIDIMARSLEHGLDGPAAELWQQSESVEPLAASEASAVRNSEVVRTDTMFPRPAATVSQGILDRGLDALPGLTSQRDEILKAGPGTVTDPELFGQFQDVCRAQAALVDGRERTVDMAVALGVTNPQAQELFLEHGVVVLGEPSEEEIGQVKAMLAAMPEKFSQDNPFILLTDADLPRGFCYGDGVVAINRQSPCGLAEIAKRLLQPLWQQESAKSAESHKAFDDSWHPFNGEGDSEVMSETPQLLYLQFYRERIDFAFTHPDAGNGIYEISGLYGGHNMIVLGDNLISCLGNFSHDSLDQLSGMFAAVPENFLRSLRIVTVETNEIAGGHYENDEVGFKEKYCLEPYRPSLDPYRDPDDRLDFVGTVFEHEVGHLVYIQLPEDKKAEWLRLHQQSTERTDYVSQYAMDALYRGGQGDPLYEDFAETFGIFVAYLATGAFDVDGLDSDVLKAKLLFMGQLFVVHEDGQDYIQVNGHNYPVCLEDGQLTQAGLSAWSHERFNEYMADAIPECYVPFLFVSDLYYLNTLALNLEPLDQSRSIFSLGTLLALLKDSEDEDTLPDLAVEHPEAFTWLFGVSAQDTDAISRLQANVQSGYEKATEEERQEPKPLLLYL